MDKYELLASPSVRNDIVSLKHTPGKTGVIDSIMALKDSSKIDFIHGNIFPGQGKEKVFLFKMLTEGDGSGVDLIKRMQPGGNLENSWIMFDHVKRVKNWTTMACHVYDSAYCKVMTIAVCDMQSEDTAAQCIMWRSLNEVMAANGVADVNFKGFMADSAQANWNAVRTIYGTGDPKQPMENRERTCLLHWTTSLNRHTQKFIKPDMQFQHNLLCKQYKNSKSMEEAETRYLAIRAWWLSSGAASEDAIRELDFWLAFWHFRYRQWGGFMQMVSASLISSNVVSLCHSDVVNKLLLMVCPSMQGLSLEEMADMPSCNLAETVHNKWKQQSGNRGDDLYVATVDDFIRAFMQATNYRAYLKGRATGMGPSKCELRLRAARRSGDPCENCNCPKYDAWCRGAMHTHPTLGRGRSLWLNQDGNLTSLLALRVILIAPIK